MNNTSTEYLILVDQFDNQIGLMEKLEAHQKGLLHRAFSIFIFNSKGEILLQKRSLEKYHSPGLWSNTCCSHPNAGEETLVAAKRRLVEEMGMSADIEEVFSFTYKAEFENGLVEHEFDHVFFGTTDAEPIINISEVSEWKYISVEDLKIDLTTSPEQYSAWLQICFNTIYKKIITKNDLTK